MSSPERMSSETSCKAGKRSNSLRTFRILSSMFVSSMSCAVGGKLVGVAPFEPGLDCERYECQSGQHRGHAEGRDLRQCSEFLVVELNLKRHGHGLAPQLAGNHGDRAEFSHG